MTLSVEQIGYKSMGTPNRVATAAAVKITRSGMRIFDGEGNLLVHMLPNEWACFRMAEELMSLGRAQALEQQRGAGGDG